MQLDALYAASSKSSEDLRKAFVLAGSAKVSFATCMYAWIRLRRLESEPATTFMSRGEKILTQLYPDMARDVTNSFMRDQLVKSLPSEVQAQAITLLSQNVLMSGDELAKAIDARLLVAIRNNETRAVKSTTPKGYGKGDKGSAAKSSETSGSEKKREPWLPAAEFRKKKEAEKAARERVAAADESAPEREHVAMCTILEAMDHESKPKN